MADMRIVKFSRTRYVIGLWWQMDTSAPGKLHRAREKARILGKFSYAVLRETQYGLGEGKGRDLGKVSLAALLAGKNSSFLAVCRMEDDLWWVCAVKNGLIAAEGDWLAKSEAEALEHAAYLRQMLGLPEAELYRSPEAVLAWVQGCLGAKKSRFPFGFDAQGRLQPLRSPWQRIAVGLGIFFGFMVYHAGFFSDNLDLQQALAARQLEILAHPERYFSRPWMKVPTPTIWSRRCLNEILALPVSSQGWDFQSAQCVDDTLTTQWQFTSGASFLHLPPGAELVTPTLAQRVQKLPPEASGPDTTLSTRDETARMLYEVANILGLELQLNWKGKSQQAYQESGLSMTLVAPWQEGQFMFRDVPTLLALDSSFYQLLESIPGLVLQDLSHRDGKWELKGICHGS